MEPRILKEFSTRSDKVYRLVAAQFAFAEGGLSTKFLMNWLDVEKHSNIRNVLYLAISSQARKHVTAFLRQRLESETIDAMERLHIQAAIVIATSLRSEMLPVMAALCSSSRRLAKAAAELIIMICDTNDKITLEFAVLLLVDRRNDDFTRSLEAILRNGVDQGETPHEQD